MAPSPRFAEFAVLEDEAARASFVDRHRQELVRAEVVQQLAEAVRHRVRVSMQEALHLAEAAILIAKELGDPVSRGLSFRAKANALFTLGRNRQSAELHEQAIAIFRECGDTTELGRSLSASIQPLSNQGKYDQALAAAAEARAIFADGQDSVRLARLDINFANILFRQDRFAEALAAYQQARDALWPDKDAEGIAVVSHNMAVCLISLNDFHRAQAEYVLAREFSERHSMPSLVLQADYNIAYLYYLRGEYRRAIDSLIATREASRASGDRQHFALCHLNLSEIYLELNLNAEAADMSQQAFAQFQELGMSYEAAKSLSNHAIALSRQRKVPEAIELFAQARARFVKEENRVWPAVIDLYQAVVSFHEGRDSEALRLCESAYAHFQESVFSAKAVLAQMLFARLALRSGDKEDALAWCSKAADRATELGSPGLVYQTSVVMGNVLEGLERKADAYRSYHSAHCIAESLRGSLRSDELKIGFMTDKSEVYQRLVDLALDGVEAEGPESAAERAFFYIEQAKSRGLRDLVVGQLHQSESAVECRSETARKIRRLREELNWFYHRIESQELGQGLGQIGSLREQAKDREQRLARLLRETSSGAESLDESEVVTIDAIRDALPPEAALIEYFRSGNRLMAAVLTRERLDLIPLSEVACVVPPLRMLQFQLARIERWADPTGAAIPPMQVHLRSLYDDLVAPLREHLGKCRRLIVVPHDVLHFVPFQALMDGDGYLIDSFSIAYAPSASVFALCGARPRESYSRSLILGVPDAQTSHIEDEAVAIANLLPDAELYLGEQATAAVLRDKGASSRFIHIATHGHFREDNPLFSSVRLGDGHLNVYDLYDLRLPAELITLSGCMTGMNGLTKGDELLGLERGLLQAGAQALLLSMWNVNDASTSQFMRTFYSRLNEFEDQPDALRSAAMELREQHPNPYYWAPFALIGNSEQRAAK